MVEQILHSQADGPLVSEGKPVLGATPLAVSKGRSGGKEEAWQHFETQ